MSSHKSFRRIFQQFSAIQTHHTIQCYRCLGMQHCPSVYSAWPAPVAQEYAQSQLPVLVGQALLPCKPSNSPSQSLHPRLFLHLSAYLPKAPERVRAEIT